MIYGIVINVITIFCFGIDKAQSREQYARRISEKTLFILSFVGGSLGALLAMKFFRHKTKKLSFQVILAIILAIQIIGFILFIQK